ncbi:hypothetical protein K431DRAFT_293994 [Polychaeton citri CBS 116435]|uniref:RING-type domain-containing protein n=1 Tax=Polychaeton citri CBS 116435 TaxID=1314669 RepID=A0A9P4UQI9_9PEZI|nr:hypothetical protein K431DRAFT_293994 [Polychaeton citri CBS 116435]
MGPYSTSSITHGRFICSICTNDESGPHRHSDGKCFCTNCIKDHLEPIFFRAVKYEMHFPPIAGDVSLDYCDFLDILPNGYESQYHEMKAQYETSPNVRLHCSNRLGMGDICGKFLGLRDAELARHCKACSIHACGKCGYPSGPDNQTHQCRSHPDATLDEDSMQNSEERRVVFQLCPVCNCKIFLGDGCNHMICPSPCCARQRDGNQVNFCYLCGDMVSGENSDHWLAGKPCPRYGRQGQGRPLWDDHTEVTADEEEREQEENNDNDSDDEDRVESETDMSDVVFRRPEGVADDTYVNDDLLRSRGLELILITGAGARQQLDWNRSSYCSAKAILGRAVLEFPAMRLSGEDHYDLFIQERRLSSVEDTVLQMRHHLSDEVTQAVINCIFALRNLALLYVFYNRGVIASRGHEASLDLLLARDSLRIMELDWPNIPDAIMRILPTLGVSKQYVDRKIVHDLLEDMEQEDIRLEEIRNEWEREELQRLWDE